MAALPNENEGYPREEIYGGTLDAEPCYEDMDDDDFAVQHSLDPSRPNGRRGRPRRDPTEPRKPVAASLFYVAERKKELIKAQAGTAPLAPDSLSMTAMTKRRPRRSGATSTTNYARRTRRRRAAIASATSSRWPATSSPRRASRWRMSSPSGW